MFHGQNFVAYRWWYIKYLNCQRILRAPRGDLSKATVVENMTVVRNHLETSISLKSLPGSLLLPRRCNVAPISHMIVWTIVSLLHFLVVLLHILREIISKSTLLISQG